MAVHSRFKPITALGRRTISFFEFIGGISYLLRDAAFSVPRGLFGRRGRRLGWKNLAAQMVRVGVQSVPIVFIVLVCLGAILALQITPILKNYGAEPEIADVISVAMFRELGPLVSAIVLTGFAGASIAAELGTMVVSEEIEALEAEAIDPLRFLVLPRVLATTIMMVCVAIVGDLTGVLGGLFVANMILGLSAHQYVLRTFEAIVARDFTTGLIKAGVFGAIISSLACYLGLNVTGGAQGVGAATTRTVVLTIVALIAVDLLFTSAFYYFGW